MSPSVTVCVEGCPFRLTPALIDPQWRSILPVRGLSSKSALCSSDIWLLQSFDRQQRLCSGTTRRNPHYDIEFDNCMLAGFSACGNPPLVCDFINISMPPIATTTDNLSLWTVWPALDAATPLAKPSTTPSFRRWQPSMGRRAARNRRIAPADLLYAVLQQPYCRIAVWADAGRRANQPIKPGKGVGAAASKITWRD